jgi:hypothetical protein
VKVTFGLLVAGVLCVGAPLAAHHSWAYEYDEAKPVTVRGKVTKIEWTNPHMHFYVDSADGQGTVTSWNFEMASPLALERNGWSRKTLAIGAEVTVGGFEGRAVRVRAVASSITMADGTKLFVAPQGQ